MPDVENRGCLGQDRVAPKRRTTGYSRQQVTRLVRQFRERGALAQRYRPPAQGFTRTYTQADVALLAEAARQLNEARRRLFLSIQRRSKQAA